MKFHRKAVMSLLVARNIARGAHEKNPTATHQSYPPTEMYGGLPISTGNIINLEHLIYRGCKAFSRLVRELLITIRWLVILGENTVLTADSNNNIRQFGASPSQVPT